MIVGVPDPFSFTDGNPGEGQGEGSVRGEREAIGEASRGRPRSRNPARKNEIPVHNGGDIGDAFAEAERQDEGRVPLGLGV